MTRNYQSLPDAPDSNIRYSNLLTEIKVAKSWNRSLDEWLAVPRWARKLIYAEYVLSGNIAFWVNEDMPKG